MALIGPIGLAVAGAKLKAFWKVCCRARNSMRDVPLWVDSHLGPEEVIEERQLSGLPFFKFGLNIPRIGDVQRHTKV